MFSRRISGFHIVPQGFEAWLTQAFYSLSPVNNPTNLIVTTVPISFKGFRELEANACSSIQLSQRVFSNCDAPGSQESLQRCIHQQGHSVCPLTGASPRQAILMPLPEPHVLDWFFPKGEHETRI